MDWRLADAKNRLSELVRKALVEGPQRIHRRKDAVVVLSEAQYRELSGEKPRFAAFLQSADDLSALELSRDPSSMRESRL